MDTFVDYDDSCEVDMLASFSQAAYGSNLEQGDVSTKGMGWYEEEEFNSQQQVDELYSDQDGYDHAIYEPFEKNTEDDEMARHNSTIEGSATTQLAMPAHDLNATPIDDFAPGGPAKKNPNLKEPRAHCNVPTGRMPSCCLPIVPEYSAKGSATIPLGGIDYMDCSDRYLTELRRSGHSFVDIIKNTVNIPSNAFKKEFAKRLEGQSLRAGYNLAEDEAKDLKNTFSMRVQRWSQAQGVLSICRANERTEDVPDPFIPALMHLSTAQIFHNTIGLIQPGSFEMWQPEDRHHWTSIAPQHSYPLPAPRDVHDVVRKALQAWGRDLGSFKDFLLRNLDRVDHYSLDPETGMAPIYAEEEVRKARSKETTTAKKAAARKAAAKNKAAAKKVSGTGMELFSQTQDHSRKRESDEDAARSSKKPRTLGPVDDNEHTPRFNPVPYHSNYYSTPEDDKISQFDAAIISSDCLDMPEGHRGLGDFSLTIEPHEIEDSSFSDHNPRIAQHHTVPSPAPSYNIQYGDFVGQHGDFVAQHGDFVDAYQHCGRWVLSSAAPTPNTRSDSGDGSGFSPDTSHSLDELIDATLQQPVAIDTMINLPLRYHPYDAMSDAGLVGEEAEWYGGDLQASASEAALNLDLNFPGEPVEYWPNESMQTRDQELGFGAGADLDFVIGDDDCVMPMFGWTQQDDSFN